jgi:uncharacterized protein YbcI
MNQAIANAVVRSYRDYAGRGPWKAHAFHRHNILVVLMEDALTTGERSLAADGRYQAVLDLRLQLLETMRGRLVEAVEELTGCRVVALMGANHIEPDLAFELFVLDRPVPGEPQLAAGSRAADSPGAARGQS